VVKKEASLGLHAVNEEERNVQRILNGYSPTAEGAAKVGGK